MHIDDDAMELPDVELVMPDERSEPANDDGEDVVADGEEDADRDSLV
jgi:hypothetical protein